MPFLLQSFALIGQVAVQCTVGKLFANPWTLRYQTHFNSHHARWPSLKCDSKKVLAALCIGNFGQLLPDMRIKDGNIAQLLSWCHTHWLSMRHFFLCIKLVSISFIGPFLKHPKGWNFHRIIGLWFYNGKAIAFNFSPWVEKQMVSMAIGCWVFQPGIQN